MSNRPQNGIPSLEPVAGNGLIDRRALLGRGILFAGATGTGVPSLTSAAAEPLAIDPWSLYLGIAIPPYERPSKYENNVVRTLTNPNNEARGSAARTPHHLLNGTITPNGLHFVVARGGFPDIDPDKHRLLIHGLVKQPLIFTLDALRALSDGLAHRASSNAGATVRRSIPKSRSRPTCRPSMAWSPAPNGPASGSPLSSRKPASIPKAKWFIAEGADLPSMNRSIPLAKAMDDAMIALYQNGERINPSNGYPMRLLLPGYEGNMNVKWLHRIKLVEAPVMAINETKQYTDAIAERKGWQFFFPQEIKSFITHPSPGLTLKGPGFYEISGLAYSGNGPINKVEVSADGGKSWALAALDAPVLSKSFTRFRIPWNWNGQPASCKAARTDEAGNVQPTRAAARSGAR